MPFKLIGAAQGWGAENKGTQEGAGHLHRVYAKWPWQALIHPRFPFNGQRVENDERYDLVLDFNTRLAQHVSALVRHEQQPFVLGGDHSIAMGTWSGVTHGLNAEEDFGLIWIDAHMDGHTFDTSPSGNIHGMPLAYLMGRRQDALAHILSKNPKLKPQNIALIGVRSYEVEEAERLQRLGVTIFSMHDVLSHGFNTCFEHALNIVNKNTKGYGISLDVDALDPEDAPATGCYEPAGIRAEDILRTFANIVKDERLKAFELAEYNPHLDAADARTQQLIARVVDLFTKEKE